MVGVGVWVVLGVDVGERVDVGVNVEVGDGVRDVVDVMEGLAPMERDDVGDRVTLEDRKGVVDTVEGGDAVAVAVGEGVAVEDGVGLAVTDGENELLAVLEGEAPTVKDDVGDNVTVELPLIVLLGVTCAVPVPLCVGEEVAVGEGVELTVTEADNEVLAVLEGEAPTVKEKAEDINIVELPLVVALKLFMELAEVIIIVAMGLPPVVGVGVSEEL